VNLQASAQQFGGAVADKESVIPRAARIFLAVELALGVAYFVLPASALRAGVYCPIELGMVVAVVVGVRTYRPSRPWAWYLLAAGQLCFTVGDAILYAYEWALRVEAPFPSVADAFYLVFYPLLAIGLLLLVRGRAREGTGRA
jgi:diguanylate cyclase